MTHLCIYDPRQEIYRRFPVLKDNIHKYVSPTSGKRGGGWPFYAGELYPDG